MMCNLNLVFRTDTEKDITGFMMAVTSSSFEGNNDGDGLYCNNRLFRSVNKLDLFKISDSIRKSRILISHQRKATSGFSEEYTQPFMNKDFVLAHNGIVNDFIGKKGSDTYGFFTNFLNKFYASKKDRDTAIVESIKELLDNKDGMFYSIVILDRKTNLAYYFKNETATINFYLGKDLLYITTASGNKVFLGMIGMGTKDYDDLLAKDYLIYRISCDDGIVITEAGEIEKCVKKDKELRWWENHNRYYDSIYDMDMKIDKKAMRSLWGY